MAFKYLSSTAHPVLQAAGAAEDADTATRRLKVADSLRKLKGYDVESDSLEVENELHAEHAMIIDGIA
jgi:hypothetical protein